MRTADAVATATHRPTPSSATGSAFAALGVARDLVAALVRAGIETPFPVQTMTIPDALAGRDVCGKARTGSGKTLAFGLPLLQRTPRSKPQRPASVVLVPTRELATQVVRNLAPLGAGRGLRIVAVVGGTSIFAQRQRLRAGVDIVVATPGRLHDLLERRDASLDDVTSVVVDEADQMADLGFMPQVQRILDRIPTKPQTLLFSATLDGEVEKLVRRYQHEPVRHEVPGAEEPVTTMAHRFIGVDDGEKVRVAATIASGPARTLFFTRTQRGADRLARLLGREGVAAGVIHGGLSQPRRERALAAFADGSAPVLVATNIAARGIHVDAVETVVHFDPPEDAKTYVHRSGRTARAGASGLVVTLVGPEQVRDVDILRRQAGIREAMVTMGADDPRLHDLAAWEPPMEAPRESRPRDAHAGGTRQGGGNGGRRYRPNSRNGARPTGGNREGAPAAGPGGRPTSRRWSR